MKKLASTLPNMILSLGLITVCAGAALGGMYILTKNKIASQETQQRLEAIRLVAPDFTNDPVADSDTLRISGLQFIVYPAVEEGKLNGAAVEGQTMSGFSGEITIMCGFNSEGEVTDYRVLRHAETPGLGSKMEEWFRDPSGARIVIGKNPSVTNFSVRKDGGDIDGITAATYSSRAFLEVLRNAYEAYREVAAEKGLQLPSVGNSGSEASTGASRSKEESEATDASTGASKKNEDAISGASGHKNEIRGEDNSERKRFKKGRENHHKRNLNRQERGRNRQNEGSGRRGKEVDE